MIETLSLIKVLKTTILPSSFKFFIFRSSSTHGVLEMVRKIILNMFFYLTPSWRRSLSYGNQSTDMKKRVKVFTIILKQPEAYSETSQTSKTECFAKIVDSEKPVTIFSKFSILNIWQDSEYASDNHFQISPRFLFLCKGRPNCSFPLFKLF